MHHKILTGLCALLLLGCETTELHSRSQDVRLTWDTPPNLQACTEKGTVIGSEGTWYNFWFFSNKDLMDGALNDIKNQAAGRGANTIDLYPFPPFDTSVTLMGNAYRCPSH